MAYVLGLWDHIKDHTDDLQLHYRKQPKKKTSARLSNSLGLSTALKLKVPADHACIESTTRDQSFRPHYSHSMIETNLTLPLPRKNLKIQFFSDAS